MDAPPPYTEADAQRAQLVATSSSSSTGHTSRPAPSSATPSYTDVVATGSTDAATSSSRLDHVGMRHQGVEEVTRDGGWHSRTHSGPVSLGPLAVQLLPTGPGITSNSDLRDQIQRQRLNLTDHTTRTLPHSAVTDDRVKIDPCSDYPSNVRESCNEMSGKINTLPRVSANASNLQYCTLENSSIDNAISHSNVASSKLSLHCDPLSLQHHHSYQGNEEQQFDDTDRGVQEAGAAALATASVDHTTSVR